MLSRQPGSLFKTLARNNTRSIKYKKLYKILAKKDLEEDRLQHVKQMTLLPMVATSLWYISRSLNVIEFWMDIVTRLQMNQSLQAVIARAF